DDRVTLVGAGVTLHHCLAAADALNDEGVPARVIDLYSLKPIDTATLTAAAVETGRLVLVEDHHPEGGLGAAVLDALAQSRTNSRAVVTHLAVTEMPESGSSAELLDAAGLGLDAIIAAAHALLGIDPA
ncbi:MAG: transketolase C-terminal domain-containing protein, partial [Acidimicrobiales bacterium]